MGVSADTLQKLGARGINLLLDIYAGDRDEAILQDGKVS
jgi:hypothetical protein